MIVALAETYDYGGDRRRQHPQRCGGGVIQESRRLTTRNLELWELMKPSGTLNDNNGRKEEKKERMQMVRGGRRPERTESWRGQPGSANGKGVSHGRAPSSPKLPSCRP